MISLFYRRRTHGQSSDNPSGDGGDEEDVDSDKEFCEKVTAIFGEDIVRIVEDKKL